MNKFYKILTLTFIVGSIIFSFSHPALAQTPAYFTPAFPTPHNLQPTTLRDALANRIQKTSSATTTKYILGPNRALPGVLAETDPSGNITCYYVYGLGLISKIEGSSAYFYQYDGLGSTVAITDSTGSLKNTYAYDDFGNLAANSTETIANPFKYVGRFGVMTDASDLLYMRERYYMPSIGRFISEDPIGVDSGLNLYAYTGNNAVNWIDPIGLSEFHFDFSKLGEKLIHAGKYRFNKSCELVEHTGKVIGKPTGKAARILKHLKNIKPDFFTDIFLLFIIPPELKADPASVFFDPSSELLWS